MKTSMPLCLFLLVLFLCSLLLSNTEAQGNKNRWWCRRFTRRTKQNCREGRRSYNNNNNNNIRESRVAYFFKGRHSKYEAVGDLERNLLGDNQ
ncbi:hypothetical protein ACROYT_G024172 [Oculina patagonica]